MPATDDANDDLAMVRVIREGTLSENISREEVFKTLGTACVHPAPTGTAGEEASQELRGAMDTIGRKLKDVPAAELEQEMDNALREVRPGYRSVRE